MPLDNFLLLIPVVYVVLQWSALRRMNHGWRWAAVMPAVAMAAALAIFVIGIATNAGLAAMWLVLGLPLATLYLIILFPIHWIVGRGA